MVVFCILGFEAGYENQLFTAGVFSRKVPRSYRPEERIGQFSLACAGAKVIVTLMEILIVGICIIFRRQNNLVILVFVDEAVHENLLRISRAVERDTFYRCLRTAFFTANIGQNSVSGVPVCVDFVDRINR